ncbi:MAG: ABC transporter substrate-binding protein [Cyanophyceae cyanobacterium]
MKSAAPVLWECSGAPPQWKAHFPIVNYSETCYICGCPKPELKTPPLLAPTALFSKRTIALGVLLSAVVVGSGVWWINQRETRLQTINLVTPLNRVSPSHSSSVPATASPERFSQGERRLLRNQSNSSADRGTNAYAQGDYERAKVFFERAVAGDRRNPEIQIYLNNALARLSNEIPLRIGVVVPVESNLSSAEEMLRGIADAQTEFNQSGGSGDRLLEIVIANDGNDPQLSPEVARTLAADADILGVIGHNSSGATAAAIEEYEQANLPIISPTSTSSLIDSPVFFRTTAESKVLAAALAQYVRQDLDLEQIAIFYIPTDPNSKGWQEAFLRRFRELGGQTAQLIDMSTPDFQPQQIKSLPFEGAILLPSTDHLTVALSIAASNQELPTQQQLKLLGNTALFTPRTLTSGGSAVENLIVSVPWVAQTPYAQRAARRWGGQVNWRTAMSYDALQAMVAAFAKDASRSTVLNSLKSVRLTPEQTSGRALEFLPSGERASRSILVQVVPGEGGPQSSKLTFRSLE